MWSVVRIQLGAVRSRPGRHLALVVAIGAATTIVVAALVAFASVAGSADRLAKLSGDADLEVAARSRAGIPEALSRALARVDGVEGAVPLVTGPRAILANGDVVRETLLLGVDVRAAALSDPLAVEVARRESEFADDPGRLLRGVFLTPRLADRIDAGIGDLVRLRHVEVRDLEVVGFLDADLTAGVNDREVAVVLRPLAEQLTGRLGVVDTLAVVTASGADRAEVSRQLAALVDPDLATVRSPSHRARVVADDVAPLAQAMLFVIGVVLGVSGLLVSQVAAITQADNRRTIGLLRSVGGGRRTVVAASAVVIGLLCLVGGLVGAVIGVVVAPVAIDRLPVVMTAATSLRLSPTVPIGTVTVVVVATALLGAVIGATVASRGGTPVELLAEPRPVDAPLHRRLGALAGGLGALVVGLWLAAVVGIEQLPRGLLTTLLLGGAVVTSWATAPNQVRLAAAVADAVGSHPRAGWQLRAEPARAWGVMTALAIPLALGIALGGMTQNGIATSDDKFASYAAVPAILRTTPDEAPPVGRPLAPDVVASVAPDTQAIERWEMVEVDGRRTLVVGVNAASHNPAFAELESWQRSRIHAGDVAVVNRAFADRRGIEEGGHLVIPTPGGGWRVEVVGVVDLVLSIENRLIGVDLDALEHRFGAAPPNSLELSAVPTDPLPPGHHVVTGTEAIDLARDGVRNVLALFELVRLLATGAAAVVVAGTLTLTVLARRRTYILLRAVGATSGALVRAVAAMAAGMVVPALVVSWMLGAILQFSLVAAARDLTGFPFTYAIAPRVVVAVTLVGVAAAAAGAVLPAAVVARSRPTPIEIDR